MLTYTLHSKGSTGNSRQFINNLDDATRLEIEFEVEAIGATPTITWAVQGLAPGGNPATAADWIVLAVVQGDSTVAASSAPIVATTVSKVRRYIDGLDKRFFDAIAVETTANTNVTYSSRLNRADRI